MVNSMGVDFRRYAKHLKSALPGARLNQEGVLYLRTVLYKLADGVGMSPSCIRDQYAPAGTRITESSLAWLTTLARILERGEHAAKVWLMVEFPGEKVAILKRDLDM